MRIHKDKGTPYPCVIPARMLHFPALCARYVQKSWKAMKRSLVPPMVCGGQRANFHFFEQKVRISTFLAKSEENGLASPYPFYCFQGFPAFPCQNADMFADPGNHRFLAQGYPGGMGNPWDSMFSGGWWRRGWGMLKCLKH